MNLEWRLICTPALGTTIAITRSYHAGKDFHTNTLDVDLTNAVLACSIDDLKAAIAAGRPLPRSQGAETSSENSSGPPLNLKRSRDTESDALDERPNGNSTGERGDDSDEDVFIDRAERKYRKVGLEKGRAAVSGESQRSALI